MPEADVAEAGTDTGAAGANDCCGGGVKVGTGSACIDASFIAAANGDPNGIAGAAAGIAAGTAVLS